MRILFVIVLLAILCQPVSAQEPIQLPASWPERPATALAIPAISLFRQVEIIRVHGDTWETGHIAYKVMHLQGTASPGEVGNAVLAGHRTLPNGMYGSFYRLDGLRVRDVVLVYVDGQKYTYVMESALVVDAAEIWVVAPTERPTLTLLTCYDWDREANRYAKRLIIRARLIAPN